MSHDASGQTPDADRARFSVLSKDLGTLIHRMHHRLPGFAPDREAESHCDVLVVGSGYGGAMSAAMLAGARTKQGDTARVWVLERGQEYLPGRFPGRMADLAGHVRFSTPEGGEPRGVRTGLFDVRLNPDVSAILANGLGGGSLINAGVMAWPSPDVWQQACWPHHIRTQSAALQMQSDDVQEMLGSRLPGGVANTVQGAGQVPTKFNALAALSHGAPFQPLPITVALKSGTSSSDGVSLKACIACGDCATGCNNGSKISLDTNLLARADRLGAQLFTGATVLRIKPHAVKGWVVHVTHTDTKLRQSQVQPVEIHTLQLILAAGTFGSTEILLRSKEDVPSSEALGTRFSANGDLLLVAFDQTLPANAVARETLPPDQRQVGPTITGMIDLRTPASASAPATPPHVVQDLAVPAALQRLFEELFTTANMLHSLSRPDVESHQSQDARTDPLAINDQVIDRSSVLAIIGHDDANGRLTLTGLKTPPADQGDGAIKLTWPQAKQDPRLDQQVDALQRRSKASGTEGNILPSPQWRPLPSGTEFLVGNQRGPLLTAHPLGGCAMSDTMEQGVVNEFGQVWRPGGDVYRDLVVLDGAIVPTSLGINPALTIATLAHRALPELIRAWGLVAHDPKDTGPTRPRAMFWKAPTFKPPEPTTVLITERLRGLVAQRQLGIELTIRFHETQLALLTRGASRKTLQVDPVHSHVRVVRLPPSGPPWSSANTVFQAGLEGRLDFFHREASTPWQRRLRVLPAWFFNRGLSDAVQAVIERFQGKGDGASVGIWQRVVDAWNLASRAGEVRRFDYQLKVGRITQGALPPEWALPSVEGHMVQGHKRLVYARRSNPLKQLMRMELSAFPGLDGLLKDTPSPIWLEMDLNHLVEQGLPLARLGRQTDMPSALVDLASLLGWMARVMLNIHVWSLRKPNRPQPREFVRLPPATKLLPEPTRTWLPVVPAMAKGQVAQALLSRYERPQNERASGAKGPVPILLIHGYSTSGTTFAHPATNSGLAGYLWSHGHDVWIVDLRTSSGLCSATNPWTFEDIAFNDLPAAVAEIRKATGHAQIDIFAHCMGSTKLWMAMLDNQPRIDPGHIRRLAMSQIAPVMRFSPTNMFRAFVARYTQHFMPLAPYYFRPESDEEPGLADQVLDRLLSVLPYPRREFDIENPWCPPWKKAPWTGTRHRMDALYGRTMNLDNIAPQALDAIDDFFGPLHLDTISQAMQFARYHAPTNKEGDSVYLRPGRLIQVLEKLPIMSIHGEDNGLSDVSGAHEFKAYLASCDAQLAAKYQIHVIPGHGHQDCLIGHRAPEQVFPHILAFFQ